MSDEKNNQNLIVGVAVVAGILGTLSALVRSSQTIQDWAEQAKSSGSHAIEKSEAVNKNMLLGGVAGGLIGAAAALFFAPKAGSDLIKDFSHPFSHQEEHPEPSRKSTAKPVTKKNPPRKKEASSSVKNQPHVAEEDKSSKSPAKKKTPRRRTATAALKNAVSDPEKVVDEVAES